MVRKFLIVIPNIAAAIAILVIGYIIARILKALVIKLLTSTKFFAKVEEFKIPEKERTVDIIGRLTFYLVMLFALLAFFNVLNLPIIAGPISTLVDTVMEYLPRVGGAAIVIFALAIALRNLGIANEIVTLAFGLLLGSIAIAAAIAFGIGAKEIAGREVDAWVKKLKGEK
jgi:hypothetical protein